MLVRIEDSSCTTTYPILQILSRFVEYKVLVLDRDGFCPPKGINLRMFERTKLFAVKLKLVDASLRLDV